MQKVCVYLLEIRCLFVPSFFQAFFQLASTKREREAFLAFHTWIFLPFDCTPVLRATVRPTIGSAMILYNVSPIWFSRGYSKSLKMIHENLRTPSQDDFIPCYKVNL